ncbi:hypothetical protein ADQ49_28360, partial [Salmonella enterica subsp. enterica]|nr:hypothetical protein [Salmonella enterica subsp. enterica serovar Enteritidis]
KANQYSQFFEGAHSGFSKKKPGIADRANNTMFNINLEVAHPPGYGQRKDDKHFSLYGSTELR